MDDNPIKILGVSESALRSIRQFMRNVTATKIPDMDLIAMIGLVHSSREIDGDQVIVRGEHFVLGAIPRSKLMDEIIICINETDIAVRIPPKARFHGFYYFDLKDGEIVNSRTPAVEG